MIRFADTGIDENILKGLTSLGFQQPTPVQEQVIPLMLSRQSDIISLAQTGTGKTAAFGLPLIQLTNINSRRTQCLVLCPTRELCVQVARDLADYARYVKGIRTLAIYGGAAIDSQIRALAKGVHIIVATPGRLNDLLNRRKVDLSAVRYVVFDEADEMLQMGFQDELNAILEKTPAEKNTLLFSATMSGEVAAIAARYMSDPVEITIGRRNAGAENISHEFYMVHARNRYPALKRIVDNSPDIYAIIFCRTRRETHEVAGKLIQDGYNADALHGDLSQAQRDQVMRKFRCRNLQLLVATDVAARGLDVNDLTHVINYNLPDDLAAYTHRSGRTGRAGHRGTSVVIINLKERFKIRRIEKEIKKKFQQCRVPSGFEICRKQLVNLADVVAGVEVDNERIEPLYREIVEKFAHLDREELVKKFVSLEFNRILEYYKDAPDLNVSQDRKKQQDNRERPRREKTAGFNSGQKFTRFFLNAGRRQGIGPQGLIGRINTIPGVGRIKVGRIDIKRNSALLEADSRFVPQILDVFQQSVINGKTISIEVAGRRNQERGRRKGAGKRQFPR